MHDQRMGNCVVNKINNAVSSSLRAQNSLSAGGQITLIRYFKRKRKIAAEPGAACLS